VHGADNKHAQKEKNNASAIGIAAGSHPLLWYPVPFRFRALPLKAEMIAVKSDLPDVRRGIQERMD
jgi:hypothetical protein